MITVSDLDAAALEAEAVIGEWEQEFLQQFNGPSDDASAVAAFIANPQANQGVPARVKRRAKWVKKQIKAQPTTAVRPQQSNPGRPADYGGIATYA